MSKRQACKNDAHRKGSSPTCDRVLLLLLVRQSMFVLNPTPPPSSFSSCPCRPTRTPKPTPPSHRRPELSPEEKQRNFDIGRRYNSKMATSHNERMADLTTKIKLKDDAISHLPELLQHAARQPDRNPPPLNRRVATYTPPIPGFDKKKAGLAGDEDAEAQLDRFRGGY